MIVISMATHTLHTNLKKNPKKNKLLLQAFWSILETTYHTHTHTHTLCVCVCSRDHMCAAQEITCALTFMHHSSSELGSKLHGCFYFFSLSFVKLPAPEAGGRAGGRTHMHALPVPSAKLFPLHCPQLHNEDDSSEASSSEQPCTSAQAAASCQDHGQAVAGPAPSSSMAAAAEGPSGSWSQGEGEVPPPPYASIDLGAAAAAPGVWLLHHMGANLSPFFPVKLSFSALDTETSFQGDFPVPPPYSVATSLPTYDEAEKAKAAAMAASSVEVIAPVRLAPRLPQSCAAAPTSQRLSQTSAGLD